MSQFNAYIKIAENRYRENVGLSFEEFEVGQKFKHRPGLTISQEDNKNEALDTINNAQLHYDNHYAEQTEWKQCLGVSSMTLQKVIGMSWKTFARRKRIIGYDNIQMSHPVFSGDTLYAESEIVGKTEYPDDCNLGILNVMTCGINQNDKVVSKIEYRILVYKKDKHPLDKTYPPDAFKLSALKFSLYRQLVDKTYMEEVGMFYEDFEVGEIYEHRPSKTFTAEENKVHALRSLEWSPQYSNIDYVETLLGERFAINETYLIGAISALTTRTFGRVVANLQWKDIVLSEPVYVGDTIYAQSTIISKRESKSRPDQAILEVATKAFNQNQILVCSYERHLLVYRKGLGPYLKAGY